MTSQMMISLLAQKVLGDFTPFKMGKVMDFNTCGYEDSLGGLELMGITPKKSIFKIPRERLKKSHF